jgi:hypothetical protein
MNDLSQENTRLLSEDDMTVSKVSGLEAEIDDLLRQAEVQRHANKALGLMAGRLRKALERIAGGFINSSCLMSNPPDWHNAFDQLQAIAKEALSEE